MNRYEILDYIERLYTSSGRVPTLLYLQIEYPKLNQLEIEAAINEFRKKVGRWEDVQ